MKKWLLPAIAGLAVVAAVLVVVLNPKSEETGAQDVAAVAEVQVESEAENASSGAAQAVSAAPILTTSASDTEGEFVILAKDLSVDQVTFVRPLENSKIELLARKGEDGTVKFALATCQSCNGAPGAFYTQNGDVLQCNNCGLTFPLNVLDQPGGGCHPIMPAEDVYTETEGGVSLNVEALVAYEPLFTNVAEH